MLSRFKAVGTSPQGVLFQSIMDLDYTCEELLPNGVHRPLTRIPAFNREGVKGFVVFYVPPIIEGEERVFQSGFRLPLEFAKTLAKGFEDSVSYSVRQQGKCHKLMLKIEIHISVELPPLKLTARFGTPVVKRETKYEEDSAQTYHVFECAPGQILVAGVQDFEVSVARV